MKNENKKKDKKKAKAASLFFFLLITSMTSYIFLFTDIIGSEPEGIKYEEGVLRVWVTWGDDRELLQPLFDRYTQATGQPVKVATRVRANDLEQALASETPPDVIILSNNALVGSYYSQGLVEPLNSWIETTSISFEDFYPSPLTQCGMPDGTFPCLPWIGNTYALYWNKDLFAAAGLDPERPPQTMEEMLEYAEKLTIKGEDGYSQVGFIPDYPKPHTALYAHMFGGAWQNQDATQLTANDQAVLNAMEWQMKFYQQLGIANGVEFVTSINRYTKSKHPILGGQRLSCQQCHLYASQSGDKIPEQGFYNGQIAMMINSSSQLGAAYIAEYNPELNYGVAALPPSEEQPERENSSFYAGSVIVIPAGALDKQAAINLIDWMMSPEILSEVAAATTSLPATRPAAKAPSLQQIPHYQVFLELLNSPQTTGLLSFPISAEVNDALAQVEKDLLHEEGRIPAEMLDKLQTEYAQMLEGN